MARPKASTAQVEDDEEEALASSVIPLIPRPETAPSNLTEFERATIARHDEERRLFLNAEDQRKKNDAKVDRDLAYSRRLLSERVKSALVAFYKDDPTAEDTVAHMMREIDPILAVGKDGRRRERGRRFMQPPFIVGAAKGPH